MLAIYKRELRSYFTTPIGYVCVAVFLFFFNYFYTFGMIRGLSSDVTQLFGGFNLLFMLLFVPILTMRILSEEKKSKIDQLLLTAPVSLSGIVVGKFLAAFTLFTIALILTIPNMVVLFIYGQPEFWIIVGNYVGMLFLVGAFISIGVFISSLTENQVISAIVSFTVIFLLSLVDQISNVFREPIITNIINWISLYKRYNDFTIGVFNFASVIFYFSVIAIFLFLTVRTLEKRRWS